MVWGFEFVFTYFRFTFGILLILLTVLAVLVVFVAERPVSAVNAVWGVAELGGIGVVPQPVVLAQLAAILKRRPRLRIAESKLFFTSTYTRLSGSLSHSTYFLQLSG